MCYRREALGKPLLDTPQMMPGRSSATCHVFLCLSLFPPPDSLANQGFFKASGLQACGWCQTTGPWGCEPLGTPSRAPPCPHPAPHGEGRQCRVPWACQDPEGCCLSFQLGRRERGFRTGFGCASQRVGSGPGRAGCHNSAAGLRGQLALPWLLPARGPAVALTSLLHPAWGLGLPASAGPHPAWGA